MPSSISKLRQPRFQGAERAPNAAQSADYTYDMLVCLEQLAAHHKQAKLARLIQAAAWEARSQAGKDCDQA